MTFDLEAFWQRGIALHVAEVTAGGHDAECEWRDNGHFLCNCRKRARIASGFTDAPFLLVSNPTCSRCDEEVTSDADGFTCETCHVTWAEANEDARGDFSDDYGVLDMAAWDEAHKGVSS